MILAELTRLIRASISLFVSCVPACNMFHCPDQKSISTNGLQSLHLDLLMNVKCGFPHQFFHHKSCSSFSASITFYCTSKTSAKNCYKIQNNSGFICSGKCITKLLDYLLDLEWVVHCSYDLWRSFGGPCYLGHYTERPDLKAHSIYCLCHLS